MNNWEDKLSNNIELIDKLAKLNNLDEKDIKNLKMIIERHPMCITEYYLNLIDWNNPNDPIKKMSIPSLEELNGDGDYDTSGESSNIKLPGLQHKYKQTALVLSTNKCYMYCRHCFRKRMVGYTNNEILDMMHESIEYINQHKEINNVLITGGDSFTLNNKIIEEYLENLSNIEHLEFIRFGTRIPVVLPMRIYEDKELLEILKKYNEKKKIFVVTQFNHPNEITIESKKAVESLKMCGIEILNQAVLLRDINDNEEILSDLLNKLLSIGINPYYIFQCRPVKYVKNHFQVPLLKGSRIIDKTKEKINGVTKRFKYVMSHPRGKIEIVGVDKANNAVFKFHQAKDEEDSNLLLIRKLNNNDKWLDKELHPIP